MSNLATVIDALAPDASSPAFPYARLSQITIPNLGTYTHEGPVINGVAMPGQWLLTDCTVEFGWEIREGNYLSGATLVPKGDPLTKIAYDVRIWTGNDAQQYNALLGTTLKKPLVSIPGTQSLSLTGSLATAVLGIDDPPLKSVGITKVVVKNVTPLFNPLAKGNGKGAWTARVEFWQWRAPVAALPIPDQQAPDPGALTPSAFQNMQTAQAKMAQDRQQALAAIAQAAGIPTP